MSDLLFALIADYGIYIVFGVTFLSCLAIPIPSSLVMLTAGGLAAAGDLALASVSVAAFLGAVFGDNTGYAIARSSGNRLKNWIMKSSKRAALFTRSEGFMDKWGGSSVFFSCWLVAPLGPYVNYVSGLTKLTWMRFALWGMLGEIVWVSIYVGLGYSFADQITALSSLLGNVSAMIVAGFATIALGVWAWRSSQVSDREAQ
jgi:membrane protein DedA with SNARE-associated domain